MAAVTQAQAGLVVVASKPDLVKNLRATWRKSAEHLAEQLARFLRILALGLPVPLVDLLLRGSGKFDWPTLLIVIAPLAETAWRQVFPALGAAKVDSAPGATIVPSQVMPTSVAVQDPVAPPELDPGAVPVPVPVEGDAAP